MPFLTPLVATPFAKHEWRLTEPLDYGTDDGRIIRVPAGFVTDLASIPAIARPIIPVNDLHREEAALHDYFYHRKGAIWDREKKHSIYYTRQEVDLIFYQTLLESAVPKWKARAMCTAVNLFGWWAWSRD